MKRLLIVLCLALIILLSLAACDKSLGGTVSTEGAETRQEALTFAETAEEQTSSSAVESIEKIETTREVDTMVRADVETVATTEIETETETEAKTEAATQAETVQEIVYAEQTYRFTEVKDRLKVLGRTQDIDDSMTCDFTASGVAFKAYIQGDFSFVVNCTAETYFTVFVDGERKGVDGRFLAEGGEDVSIEVGDLGDMALREIRILKQTESQMSLSVLKSMTFYGALDSAAEQRDLYIEFIGDSITCGYGNLSEGVGTDFMGTAPYQDGTRTYAFLAAEALGADCGVMSCSGIGLDLGWTAFNKMDFYTKASYHRSAEVVQDFSSLRVPDLVVINLGTNDFGRGSSEAQYKQNLKELISFIRTSYGKDMPIVWAYNMMGDCYFHFTAAVLEELGGEAAGFYSVMLNKDQTGGNGHPSMAAHEIASVTLADYIKNNVLS